MSGMSVFHVIPDDILRVIVQESDNALMCMRVSKKVRELDVFQGAKISLRENRRFLFQVGTVPVEHMKTVLRGATRLLRDHKFIITSVHHSWSYLIKICSRHGDCGKNPGLGEHQNCNHLSGNLFDLLELKTLVEACPSFTLHRKDQVCTKVHTTEAHFTVIVRPFNEESWEVDLSITSQPKKFVQEVWMPSNRRPYIMGNFFEVRATWD